MDDHGVERPLTERHLWVVIGAIVVGALALGVALLAVAILLPTG